VIEHLDEEVPSETDVGSQIGDRQAVTLRRVSERRLRVRRSLKTYMTP